MNGPQPISRYRSAAILLAGDFAAALVFVYAGQRQHDLIDPASPLWGVLRTTAYFVVPWLCTVVALRAWPLDGEPGAWPLITRSLNAWLVAAPLGVLLRGSLLGRAVVPSVFFLATYVFGGLFLVGWRVAFALARGRLLSRR
jgi:hypothetical protein